MLEASALLEEERWWSQVCEHVVTYFCQPGKSAGHLAKSVRGLLAGGSCCRRGGIAGCGREEESDNAATWGLAEWEAAFVTVCSATKPVRLPHPLVAPL